jgi:hypothetical protein
MYEMTLAEINSLGLNDQAYQELISIKENAVDTVMNYVDEFIQGLRYPSGRKIRSERRNSMSKVIRILYDYLIKGDTADCAPAMRTIAYAIDPNLERICDNDTIESIRSKEKAMSPILMLVQRTIQVLKDFGLIRIHTYRAETNRNDDPDNPNWNNPNFYYEIVPVSVFCSAFRHFLSTCKKAIKKISDIVKSIIESLQDKYVDKSVSKANFYSPDWEDKQDGSKYLNSSRIGFDSNIYK